MHLTQQHQKRLKLALFFLALLPFVRLVAFALQGRLGANPVEFITRNSGDWTLYFLCFTLAITPLRKLSGWNWLIGWRRMLGLYTFSYASLHFLTFFWFDHFFDIEEMWADVVKRPFITVGFLAFVALLPLAATSTNGMIKRLGGKRWQWLHKLIYPISLLAVLHFYWMKAGKHDLVQPLLFALLVLSLLALRLWWKWRSGHRLAA
ncbi:MULTISPECIES: protein-methionine-sulfoxide reductase heme-binding subunit MsrQ [unclassified Undibacterium]|uniref:sulfite oxidase heme-binding subunit YedZ n=1 Tax=unclassified Undibacterium TaxID=2630295 RepID=UPI002AC923E2|nr:MULTISPECIES: protein-methionine-sulfoxide reductase heme-binding subunit MsrQ [unclassified Undibacterium]MEB0137528.1 protein-methionine-sulfoxide reductase heme-binding subunit MsrQ [Undibacterium sp. CCC2.1]MEB0170807.1 protein-methionine-sulfoxide reductase heme-binding subunit MsrQ [Undibacterium sp. CCC1.1]MEB0174759.1 protein-methionine-sulfoxide reductase heme-binding subunit MsrQ [Undibacterium sp. CCC3.4]MEB0214095.1 protein-methionine-sulfoxide reductase heme-binding subunit MsrQ